MEKFEREPWKKIGITFFWGAVFGVILGLVFSFLLMSAFGIDTPGRVYSSVGATGTLAIILLAVIVAPLVEEAVKGMSIFSAGSDLDEVEDGLIYGSSVGLGFAATENLMYGIIALAYFDWSVYIATAILRSVSSAFLHASATAVTGYGIGRMKILGGKNRVWPFFLIAVGMHAIFNLFASMGSFFGLVFAVMFAFVAIWFLRNKIKQLDVSSAS
jgi:RsiW-degrading membrane proteinase PrsW (M82 family)